MLTEMEVHLTTEDGARLSLWRLQNEAATVRAGICNVFLTHGTFSDRRICQGIAKQLARIGYVCWTLEWRGHGNSSTVKAPCNFDTVAQFDVLAALEYLQQQNVTRLHCVTHSGGGLVLTMCLTRNPRLVPLVEKIVLFACQALHAAPSKANKWLVRGISLAARLYGSIPGRRLRLGIQDETHFMMQQWFQWNIREKFMGEDGFDYWENMGKLDLPVMSVAGTADAWIAPATACRKYLDGFGGNDKFFIECGLSSGFSIDYTHSSVLHSRAAQSEIWPIALEWLASEVQSSRADQKTRRS